MPVVVAAESLWKQSRDHLDAYQFVILATLKGDVTASIVITEPGGIVGGTRAVDAGPAFSFLG